MIGKVYLSVVNYYDTATQSTRRKSRPVLIVGGPHNNDYTILPISTISKRENVDPKYDILISPSARTVLNLHRECFIRTHKQMPMHIGELVREIGDMKKDIPDLYQRAVELMKFFQDDVYHNV